ncbi:hypothetical protein ABFA25_10715 [Mycobacterium lepromatosis]|uniref:hypothetical protein n=1 Tax=Mycobacterium lepromatosis TaxID=480418 RepID=UPI000A939AAD|nr:hypothetical protein MLPF_1728 [Mycobacterium lepromatosis]
MLNELLRRAGGVVTRRTGSLALNLAGLRDEPSDPALAARIYGAVYLWSPCCWPGSVRVQLSPVDVRSTNIAPC